MLSFSDDFLCALNAWQNGWREDQVRRLALAAELRRRAMEVDPSFRVVLEPCYRKRFVHRGELVDLLLKDHLDEGTTSWTTDDRFAERFKGLARDNAVCAAIYSHSPCADEVVVNVGALWQNPSFVVAAKAFRAQHPADAEALFHFRDRQSEVVLTAPLKGSEIVALSGASSPFDELCDRAGIPESQREAAFRKLVDEGVYPGGLQYTYNAQNAIAQTIRTFVERIEALKRETAGAK